MTGHNPAFIIDNETKEALINEDPKSTEIIKPVLRGEDIKRYQAQWAERWLIMTLPYLKIDIEAYPAIKRHLLSFGKDRLEQSGKGLPDGSKSRKKTSHQWFELQDTCAYYEEFAKEKLFWPEMSDKGRFAYDNDKMAGNNKTFIITGSSLKYLCAVLNSSLIYFFVRQKMPSLGNHAFQWEKYTVESLPIPPISPSGQRPLIHVIDTILADKIAAPKTDTAKLEAKINHLVYNLYGLTEDEIKIVEGQK